ncbi:hypothetical protein [Gordonia sp. NPDC003585]
MTGPSWFDVAAAELAVQVAHEPDLLLVNAHCPTLFRNAGMKGVDQG